MAGVVPYQASLVRRPVPQHTALLLQSTQNPLALSNPSCLDEHIREVEIQTSSQPPPSPCRLRPRTRRTHCRTQAAALRHCCGGAHHYTNYRSRRPRHTPAAQTRDAVVQRERPRRCHHLPRPPHPPRTASRARRRIHAQTAGTPPARATAALRAPHAAPPHQRAAARLARGGPRGRVSRTRPPRHRSQRA